MNWTAEIFKSRRNYEIFNSQAGRVIYSLDWRSLSVNKIYFNFAILKPRSEFNFDFDHKILAR